MISLKILLKILTFLIIFVDCIKIFNIFAYRFKNKSKNKFNKKLKNKEKNQGFNNKKINEYDNTRN